MYKKYYGYGTAIHTYRFNLETHKLTYEIGQPGKLETLQQIAPDADCVINWNVFDWNTGKDGYGRRKSDGKVYTGHSQNFPTWNIADGIMSVGSKQDSTLESSYWRTLVVNGEIKISNPPGDNGHVKDARNAIAQLDDGDFLLVAVEGDDTKKRGMTDTELAMWLYGIRAKEAYTNDGGGSVAMYTKDGYKYNQGRAIAGALVVRKKSLVDMCLEKVGCGYVWGCQGEILTPELLNRLKKMHGVQHYDFYMGGTKKVSASKWMGKQCFDCSGLIVWAGNKLGIIQGDYTAAGLYGLCESVQNPVRGDLCFNSSLTHVGIYLGSNQYLHAKGTYWGVVITNKYTFTKFGRLKGVSRMGKIESNEEFVRYFQKARGLKVDGWAGPVTTAELDKVLKGSGSNEELEKIKNALKVLKEVSI